MRPPARPLKALLVPLAMLVLLLAGCAGEEDAARASDPASDTSAPARPPAPSAVPAAPGPVRSTALPTVMDAGPEGPVLCLGPIAESYPPQCSGPAITNWSWQRDGQGMFEQQGDVRWGTFAVTGTWDGTAFTVTEAIPGPLYDPMMSEPVVLPAPSVAYDPAELERIATETSSLPGAQGSYGDDEGHVLLDVTYDDGTLQDYVDAAYGDGVVVVRGLLADAG
ncbi:hypothetical protein [Nocardioides sp.]|uniref:hypothetical protein n=1 Tax=Nocardioides sp. TaxID=35761 RepID=UPI0035125949